MARRPIVLLAAILVAFAFLAVGTSCCAVPAVDVGAPAPDFELTADDGRTVRLSDVLAASNVVLFFYAADGTPG